MDSAVELLLSLARSDRWGRPARLDPQALPARKVWQAQRGLPAHSRCPIPAASQPAMTRSTLPISPGWGLQATVAVSARAWRVPEEAAVAQAFSDLEEAGAALALGAQEARSWVAPVRPAA